MHDEAVLALQLSVVERLPAGENGQKRAFARPVAADQADPLSGFDRKGGFVEKRQVAEGEMGVGKGDEGHESGGMK